MHIFSFKNIFKNFLFAIFLSAAFFANGCIIVRTPDDVETEDIELSPKPEIAMSEEIVRSREGDMIAFLPGGWFFVDIENKAPSEIFAVAVNPDYTLSAVFTSFKSSEEQAENALALARKSLERHERKTAGSVKQIGKFSTTKIGLKEFGLYETSATGGALKTHTAVFISSLGNYYEFAIVPLNVSGKSLPAEEEIQKIFRSILATTQF
ncbi:MAG: hypothetical protein V4642_09800 [Bacteroidota bacterium]